MIIYPGDFFDQMAEGDEELVWEGRHEDFEFLGYRRFYCGRPEAPNPSLHRTG